MGNYTFQITNQCNFTVHLKELATDRKITEENYYRTRQQPQAFEIRRDFTWHFVLSYQTAKTQWSISYVFFI